MIPQTAARTPPSDGVDPLTGIAYSEDTTYTYLYSSEITTLNYLTTSVAQNQKALANFVDTLVEYDAYGNVVPCLAESWTQSDDGLTWTFNLRKDAKWFDCGGNEVAPVTANDFVYAARLVADPKFDSDMPDMLIQYIENGVELHNGVIDDFTQLGVEAADDYTLVYHLRQPCAYFVTLLTYGCYLPINGEFYESLALENPTPVINDDGTEGDPITNDFGTDRDKILCCGGYLCSTWLPQEKLTWVKNEKYWDADNIFITKVDYIVSEGLMNIHPEMSKEERTQKVSQALLEVGLLPEFASRFPHEFSGGQRQRIGIARSLIMEPEFIIAVIHKGVIVELAEAEQLFAHPLHPYTRALLSLTRGQMNAVSAKMNEYAETVEKTKKSTKKTALFHEKWEKTGILRRKPEGQGQSIG